MYVAESCCLWHFQGWPEASYPPRGNSKVRVASLSQETFCISTNCLEENFGKELRSNASILAWSEGIPAQSVTCSLLCWTRVLQEVVVRVQNFSMAMSTLGGRAMPGSLVTHCLLQVWAAGDRQVAVFPPCGGLVTFPGESGVAWVELRMPGP